ncbi:MAG: heme ABC exporter ATP-binding protein CcmA [Rhodospirillales bacterium]|nr:heme ABC exporter ATP-binding protein CcmA [Rhodospirillales bacterium]
MVFEAIAAVRAERLVLAGVSGGVGHGGALVLRGANGAGKSTLLRVLAGLLRPDEGRIAWDGEPFEDLPSWSRHIAYVGHLDALKPGLTVAENLRPWAVAAGRGVEPALAVMGLEALVAVPARFLSAGQRRRAVLARLALSAAPLWLLDEPTNALDAASLARLEALLAAHREAGGAVVAATHQDFVLPGAATLELVG